MFHPDIMAEIYGIRFDLLDPSKTQKDSIPENPG
jgi:hypothetical protein